LWFDKGELEEILSLELEEGDVAFTQVREFLGRFGGHAKASSSAEVDPTEEETA